MKNNYKEIIIFSTLLLIGVLSRTILEFGPNVELVTAVGLTGGLFLKSRLKYLLPLIIMILTDLYLGNTLIFLFTWSAYIISPIFSKFINTENLKNTYLSSIGSGVVFVLFFYVWTNLGVVLLSNMYPNTLAGLLSSYINAIPFLVNQLTSTILSVPVIMSLGMLLDKNISFNRKLNIHD